MNFYQCNHRTWQPQHWWIHNFWSHKIWTRQDSARVPVTLNQLRFSWWVRETNYCHHRRSQESRTDLSGSKSSREFLLSANSDISLEWRLRRLKLMIYCLLLMIQSLRQPSHSLRTRNREWSPLTVGLESCKNPWILNSNSHIISLQHHMADSKGC